MSKYCFMNTLTIKTISLLLIYFCTQFYILKKVKDIMVLQLSGSNNFLKISSNSVDHTFYVDGT